MLRDLHHVMHFILRDLHHVIYPTQLMLRVLRHVQLRDLHHVIPITCVTHVMWSASPSLFNPHDPCHDGDPGHRNEDYSEILPRLIACDLSPTS